MIPLFHKYIKGRQRRGFESNLIYDKGRGNRHSTRKRIQSNDSKDDPYSGEKTASSVSDAGKTGQLHVKE